MKHLWKGASALLLFAAIALACAPGCVDAEAPFFIKNAVYIGCDDVTVDSVQIGSGTMDVRYQCGYRAILVLGNQLVRRGDETKLQLETSRIAVTSFDVEVLDASGAPIENAGGAAAFTVASNGFIDPASSSEPGLGLAEVLLVDGATAQTLAQQGGGMIIARVTAHGRTLGGDDITSRPWDFPISVCDGCLCVEPSDDTCIDPAAAPKDACATGQDTSFDCRFLGGHTCNEKAVCGQF